MSKSPIARAKSYPLGRLVKRVEATMQRVGGAPSEWVVGVAAYPERALYRTHRVDPAGAEHVWIAAASPIAARAVALYFHDLGCLGRTLWDEEALYVYAYRRGPGTWP